MRRRYERRRAAKAKAAAAATATAAAENAAPSAPGPAETSLATSNGATATPKKRQTLVHAAAQIKLLVHSLEFQNGEEIVLNPESFPQLKELVWKDYVVEVFHPDVSAELREGSASLAQGSPQNHLLLEIPESSAAPLKGKMQVSVLKDTAAMFQLAPFKDVTVRFLPKAQVEVDFVEVSLKDQFMSRRDLMYLKDSMVGSALYVEKTIRVQGTRWQVLDIRAGGEKVRSGVVSTNTKFTFRSRTSRIMWLVQISPEMWDMANSGKLYLEIFLDVVRNVLNKWMKHSVSHSLTILFYSRCYYPEMDKDQETSSHHHFTAKRRQSRAVEDERESSFPYERSDCFSVGVDEDGRHYQDFYKLVVFDNQITDVQPLLVKLKEEMNAFPLACGWRSPADFYVSSFSPEAERIVDELSPRSGVPSNARDGNLLEAVNLVLNIFEKHHIDRDLSRSGQSVVLITPGNGIFSVNKRLSEITEQRMMDHGIGIDLISLASRPLHKCPLFLFKQSDISEMKLPSRKEGNLGAEVCLCNNNQYASKAESSLSDDDRDIPSCTVPSASGSIYDDVILAGLNSDLVRGRAASMNKLLQEYEKYDDDVFGFAPLPTRFAQKLSDSDMSTRACPSTPPLRPGMPYLNSMVKKRVGTYGFHSGSAGNGNENGSNNSGGTRWRHFEQREPSPLNVDMPEYRGSLEATVGSLDEDKPRVTSSSYQNPHQLEGSGPSHTPFTTSPVLRPVETGRQEDIFHSQAFILKQLTSNQRRWSQVRPSGDQRYKLAQNVLKWRSLCFPALLPLTSDFMPAPKELQAHYTESFYSVMLPERDEQNGVMFRDYRELVMEMVAQRLSQDFQLVTVEDSNEATDKNDSVFRLSMGHRIHEIVYNEETQTIDVKRYLQKVTTRSDVDIMEYRYSLWSPVADRFVTVSQEFRKYLQIEYQWNHLDQLICGYIDDMSEGIRYKRILYCLIPPRLGGSDVGDQENLRDYTEGCRKLLEFLRGKADASTGFPNVKLSTDWHENITTSGSGAFKRVGQRSVKMLLNTNDAVTSQNWVITKVDTEVLPTQCYHIEIQWLVCRSSLVDDLITTLGRRVKQLGLELQKVAENGVSSNLDLHPLVSPIFLKVSDPYEQSLIEKALVERFDFICEALHPIPFTHLNHHEEYQIVAQEPRPPRARRMIWYYRQYIHRSLACFARMTQTGLVWISNHQVHDDDIQEVFDELRQYVESLQVARSALIGVLDDVFSSPTVKGASLKHSKGTGNDFNQANNTSSSGQHSASTAPSSSSNSNSSSTTPVRTVAVARSNSFSEGEKENAATSANMGHQEARNRHDSATSAAVGDIDAVWRAPAEKCVDLAAAVVEPVAHGPADELPEPVEAVVIPPASATHRDQCCGSS
ncbi:GATOR complex protein depdc5 [Phytophthora boehmeriae]|uniref:GATOR complex protein depdc5 n=1 Tax=Phytophthora boehmeriae TaxID=109152 RepID=A0A8T1WMZ6_9STRA|nr:GATOR complex protein depdc5 [Phytophthora boehmeriae]